MTDKCVMINGSLVRVSKEFDETPGSEDMKTMEDFMEHLIKAVEKKMEAESNG